MTKSHLASQFYVCKRMILWGSVGERLLGRVSACSQDPEVGGTSVTVPSAISNLRVVMRERSVPVMRMKRDLFDEMDSVNLTRAEHAGEARREAVFTYHF